MLLNEESLAIKVEMIEPVYNVTNKKTGIAKFKVTTPYGIKSVFINDIEVMKEDGDIYSLPFEHQEGSNIFNISVTDNNDIVAKQSFNWQINIRYYVPILKYHHISNELTNSLYEQPELFDEQMKYLHENGYNSITFEQLNDYLLREVELPPKSIIISFDDGYYDNYTNAFPILQKYGFIGSIGVITGKVEPEGRTKRMYLKWSEIQTMSAAGIEIVSHSVNHKELDKLNDADLTIEIRDSKTTLEQKLGKAVKTIIYPYGMENENVIQKAKEYGYEAGRGNVVTSYPSKEGIYNLPAIGIYRDMGANELKLELDRY
jgi:peptidoglycan/xylan/chitin deacetylase (PgdA/CDA1 family)